MDSAFSNTTNATSTLRTLLKKEIIEAIAPASISRPGRRTRKHMMEEVVQLGIDEKKCLYDAVIKKRGTQRRGVARVDNELYDDTVEKGLKRGRLSRSSDGERQSKRRKKMADTTTSACFMDTPMEQDSRDRLSEYIDATNNNSMKTSVCIACARTIAASKATWIEIISIPNKHRLTPDVTHKAHEMINGMLLHNPFVSPRHGRLGGSICEHCFSDLRRDKIPLYSLANGMWLGIIPPELAVLTLPERLLIARYLPAAYIVKLYPKSKWDKRSLNYALKGNVSTYHLDTKLIANMVEGTLMPWPSKVIAATIGITIVGARNVPERCLPEFLHVRRGRVQAALVWLQKNNPFYQHITISEERLHSLPEDGLPSEVVAVTKYSDDRDLLAQEQDGYVPSDEDEDNIEDVDRPAGGLTDIEEDDANVVQTDEPANLVSLQTHGVIDVGANSVGDGDLMAHALANLSQEDSQPSYVVKHSSAFVNEYARRDREGNLTDGGIENPSHLLGAFPWLFPYGRGGFEVKRPRKVTYENHVRWALQYEDKRFRHDISFIFQVFGVIQKRQMCRAAELQIHRSSFLRNEELIKSVTPLDLRKASYEEQRRAPYSNPAVKEIRRHISAVRSKVMGTDESRTNIRSKVKLKVIAVDDLHTNAQSQIWGMTMMNGPPSLWITINPSDTNDPIAQVMAGHEIDLDRFVDTAGPDALTRSRTVAEDPFAAAKFFHFTISTILETLFGFTRNKFKIERRTGIVGRVKGYIGAVEAQGRGTLHLHILMWLCGAPTSQEMRGLLSTSDFRQKVIRFIDTCIRADLDGQNGHTIRHLPKQKEIAYSRPPDPRQEGFETVAKEMESKIARATQVHTCSRERCMVSKDGFLQCKRNAPFPTSDESWISEDGSWGPKRTYAYLNNWNPTLLLATRSNHDIKLITNGHETKAITWYITNYATKKQHNSYNTSALLAKRLAYHQKQEKYTSDCNLLNKRLLTSCSNSLTREQEFSSQQVISYLMGLGDRYISHYFGTIFWDTISGCLKRSFPELRWKSHNVLNNEPTSGTQEDNMETEIVRLTVEEGQLVIKDQLRDYQDRSPELDSMNLLDFFLETYEAKSSTAEETTTNEIDETTDEEIFEEEHNEGRRRVGRPCNDRYYYREGSGREKKYRIQRTTGHETMPDIIGKWFPRRDEKTEFPLYCASILVLLKPWQNLSDIKGHSLSFPEEFNKWKEGVNSETLDIIENINYFHECSDGAAKQRRIRQQEKRPVNDVYMMAEEDELEMAEEQGFGSTPPTNAEYTEEDVEAAREGIQPARDRLYAETALRIAEDVGFFHDTATTGCWKDPARRATTEDMKQYAEWASIIQNIKKKNPDSMPTIIDVPTTNYHNTPPLSVDEAANVHALPQKKTKNFEQQEITLNCEQQRAYDIVMGQLEAELDQRHPKQLLMTVIGHGGTGKSTWIKAVSDGFQRYGVEHLLAKTATTGIAASSIAATTLHWWAGLPIISPSTNKWLERPGRAMAERRNQNILGKKFLIIEEVSMLTTDVFAMVSQVIGHVRGSDTTAPFGGLNVIIVGDFHQFPPVAKSNSTLYHGTNRKPTAQLGNTLYNQFETVVIFREQRRIVDAKWMDILARLREGECSTDDIKEIRGLVITSDKCQIPDFGKFPWSDATLVTPRHTVRKAWNKASLRRHCKKTNNIRYICNAEDKKGHDREELTMTERREVASLPTKKSGRLPGQMELAVGMKALVTWNIATDAELANGTRGIIRDIVLDPREESGCHDGAKTLKYPPVMILFQPFNPLREKITNVEDGLIPIFPTETTFSIQSAGSKITISRRQLAIDMGYAFTDYRAQGQTLEYVIIDIASPPSGSLSPFNVYVALSRSHGRHSIRLLRDFDEELFTKHPSEMLRKEDERLRRLDNATRLKYELQQRR